MTNESAVPATSRQVKGWIIVPRGLVRFLLGTRVFSDNLYVTPRIALHSACVAYERHPPETTLPVRGQGRSTLPGGRHRRPASADLPPDAPALVLAVPSAPTAGGAQGPE